MGQSTEVFLRSIDAFVGDKRFNASDFLSAIALLCRQITEMIGEVPRFEDFVNTRLFTLHEVFDQFSC
ncbi:hypothetical protein L1887_09976 [Cichorium endivia]|nr:hypothetical protein L1887_09976 [Cichorium endivia]